MRLKIRKLFRISILILISILLCQVVLSLMGMMVIAMSLGASFGFCFYLGLYFSDMHPCLPFLLLGIGVDDMFVIVQAVENLSASERKLPIDQRVGKAMRHAGVSITVTSVTDMAAFLIGSTSVRKVGTVVEKILPKMPHFYLLR